MIRLRSIRTIGILVTLSIQPRVAQAQPVSGKALAAVQAKRHRLELRCKAKYAAYARDAQTFDEKMHRGEISVSDDAALKKLGEEAERRFKRPAEAACRAYWESFYELEMPEEDYIRKGTAVAREAAVVLDRASDCPLCPQISMTASLLNLDLTHCRPARSKGEVDACVSAARNRICELLVTFRSEYGSTAATWLTENLGLILVNETTTEVLRRLSCE